MSGPPDRDSPRRIVSPRLGGFCVLLVLTACGEKEADPVVRDDPSRASSVLVRPDATLLEVDDTVRLVAEVRDQDGEVISDWTIDWTAGHSLVDGSGTRFFTPLSLPFQSGNKT